jgi:hypothetical protein
MTEEPEPEKRRLDDPLTAMFNRGRDRRERIVQEILANRRGEYRVPTWVLALALVALIAAIVIALVLV